MAVSMKSSVIPSGSSANKSFDSTKQMKIPPHSFNSIRYLKSESLRQFLVAPDRIWSPKSRKRLYVNASYIGSRTMRWWEKTRKPNMEEINSAQELVDTLKNAGDKLVVIDFYSPACGGCRALHPKICQLAESNPETIFLKVNHEELKKMCKTLHINVLPFFRFYRGSKGRLCSFSCTLSTISKFKDTLAKWTSMELQTGVGDRAKGLEVSELLSLAEVGEISRVPETQLPGQEMESLLMKIMKNSSLPRMTEEDNSLLVA